MCIKRRRKSFGKDETGAVVLIVGLVLTVLMGFLALGVDLGALYFRQKSLQTHTDLAAITAVSNLHTTPEASARDTLVGNGLDRGAMTAITYGRYLPDPDLAPDQRLAPRAAGAGDANAVTVQVTDLAPLYFARSFMATDTTRIGATATAARFDLASFSLGSRLVSLQGGVLNALLSEALGTSVAFNVLDYNALADSRINLLAFTDALAARADLTLADYKDILNSDINLGDVAGALLDTGIAPQATALVTAVLNSGGAAVLNAAQLVAVQGDYVAAQLEDVLPTIEVSALEMLMAAADVVNAGRIVSTSLNAGIPGLTSVQLDLIVGEREVGSGWIVLGERNASLHTSQIRMRLDLRFAPSILSGINGGLDIASVALPLYVSVAGASATLSDLNCAAMEPDDIVARFDTGVDPLDSAAGTHVAQVFLGTIDSGDFMNTAQPLDPADLAPAKFLGVKIRPLFLGVLDADVTLRSHARVGTSSQGETNFTLAEVPPQEPLGTTKPIGSRALLTSAVGTLVSTADVKVKLSVLGINLSLVDSLLNAVLGTVRSQLNPILLALLTPVDGLVDNLLAELGVGIGEADLTLNDITCDKIMLVR